jgi:hypothetical protein
MPELTKDIFCAKDQIVTPHKGAIDAGGEFVFTCQNEGCDRFIKLPADTDPQDFNTFVEAHKAANEGQVSIEAQEKKLAEIMASKPEDEEPVD